MQKMFEEAEKKIDEQYSDFNPKLLTEESKKMHCVFVEGLGKVKFGALTFNDILKIEESSKSMADRGVQYLYAMLKKAYPDLTLEDVKGWDSNQVGKITLALQKAGFFSQAPK